MQTSRELAADPAMTATSRERYRVQLEASIKETAKAVKQAVANGQLADPDAMEQTIGDILQRHVLQPAEAIVNAQVDKTVKAGYLRAERLLKAEGFEPPATASKGAEL